MPNPQRQKGDRFEREVVEIFREAGVPAVRVPLSGSAGGPFDADVEIVFEGQKHKIECKIRKRAWSDLYSWISGNFALIIRCNNQKPLVVIPLSTFSKLVAEKWD